MSSRKSLTREVIVLYALTLLVSAGLTALQGSVGWIRGYLTTIVAGVFIFLPLELLHRKGEDPATLGIHGDERIRALKWAFLAMLVVFPPYLVAFHGWQTQWLDNQPQVAEARFDRWPTQMQDPPRLARPEPGEVWLFTQGERVWVQWHLPAGQVFEAKLESEPAPVAISGRHLVRPEAGGAAIRGPSDGRVALDVSGGALTLAARAGGEALPGDRLRLGTALASAGENPYRAERGYWWLIELILLQLLLVALPEELFYRGYLQGRLDGLIGRDRRILGVEINVASVALTSALFAVGHIVTIPNPARLAVFFPSLLFGWLRRASGGILAPIIFHAACNLLVDVAARFYG